jgi:uncharacterized phage protein (predicted DNA packaging)
MTTTPLTLLKAQLNLDHELDDDLLTHKLGVAEEWVGAYVGKSFADHDPVPASLTEAALQLAAHWYGQREAVSDVRMLPVPYGVIDLLAPFKDRITGHVA